MASEDRSAASECPACEDSTCTHGKGCFLEVFDELSVPCQEPERSALVDGEGTSAATVDHKQRLKEYAVWGGKDSTYQWALESSTAWRRTTGAPCNLIRSAASPSPELVFLARRLVRKAGDNGVSSDALIACAATGSPMSDEFARLRALLRGVLARTSQPSPGQTLIEKEEG